METFCKSYEVRWADMDPNRHMRHSVYNDYAAQTRVAIFSEFGLPLDEIGSLGLGPILFREEVKFLREVKMYEVITVYCYVNKLRSDGSRWSIFHPMYKNEDIPVAEVRVDGAWLDLETRKLGIPPDALIYTMKKFPRRDDFQWIE